MGATVPRQKPFAASGPAGMADTNSMLPMTGPQQGAVAASPYVAPPPAPAAAPSPFYGPNPVAPQPRRISGGGSMYRNPRFQSVV